MKTKKGINIRRKMREIAIQLLYQSDFDKDLFKQNIEERIREIAKIENPDIRISKSNLTFCREMFEGVVHSRKELNAYIEEFSDNWEFERISAVDKNILQIAVYELLNIDVPASVTINEAIEISKKFGDRGSYRFINGILNSFRKSKGIEKF